MYICPLNDLVYTNQTRTLKNVHPLYKYKYNLVRSPVTFGFSFQFDVFQLGTRSLGSPDNVIYLFSLFFFFFFFFPIQSKRTCSARLSRDCACAISSHQLCPRIMMAVLTKSHAAYIRRRTTIKLDYNTLLFCN